MSISAPTTKYHCRPPSSIFPPSRVHLHLLGWSADQDTSRQRPAAPREQAVYADCVVLGLPRRIGCFQVRTGHPSPQSSQLTPILPWHPSATGAAHLLLQNITSPPAATYSDKTCPCRRRRQSPFCPLLGVRSHVAHAHWASSPCRPKTLAPCRAP